MKHEKEVIRFLLESGLGWSSDIFTFICIFRDFT